ncbi:hypothetical protein NU10_02260 [Flavobacterium dauae]|uniref:hypothetical protein n=1 Tax=Flavobacterium dauae TaxID=1563479 RepID=UPI00101B2825|nr:hypothetical protein [Flavobacterium dauae]WLD24244.1 hypothetical protein NU10_02260 [Flavobacterium dauae]
MKKVFLSLAAITLVATGSLTMTSCGSDDSAPVVPPVELTENFMKHDGEQFALDGAEYSVDVDAEGNLMIYTLTDMEGYYIYYSTYFWKGDIASATSIADLDAYGSVGYYVELQDVVVDEEGVITGYTMVYPNEASELLIASAGAAANGESVGQASAASININTFTVSEGVGTSDFDGSITAGAGVTFDWNGDITFGAVDASAGKKASTFKKLDQELNKTVKLKGSVVATMKMSK